MFIKEAKIMISLVLRRQRTSLLLACSKIAELFSDLYKHATLTDSKLL